MRANPDRAEGPNALLRWPPAAIGLSRANDSSAMPRSDTPKGRAVPIAGLDRRLFPGIGGWSTPAAGRFDVAGPAETASFAQGPVKPSVGQRPAPAAGSQAPRTDGATTRAVGWGPVKYAASPGQGTASQAEIAIQQAYASGKGGVYVVDPQVMQMERGIDIDSQIAESVSNGGDMSRIYGQAMRSPTGTVSFTWPRKAFRNSALSPAGRGPGRFHGTVSGVMTVDKTTGAYRTTGSIAVADDQYNWEPDGGDFLANALIGLGANTPNINAKRGWIHGYPPPNKRGKTITLKYNRDYSFPLSGRR